MCFHAGFLHGVFYPEEGGNMFLLTSVDLNGLHGYISQKIESFVTTAERTSNPTSVLFTKLFKYPRGGQCKVYVHTSKSPLKHVSYYR
jgi:hypothetical protein